MLEGGERERVENNGKMDANVERGNGHGDDGKKQM
jgi:hypothetical protein